MSILKTFIHFVIPQRSQRRLWFLIVISSLLFNSCSKEYLEAKPQSSLIVPTTLEDCDKLIHNSFVMNFNFPDLGQVGSDDYFVSYNTWIAADVLSEKNAYIWANDIYEGILSVNEWNNSFNAIYTANVVLEAIEKIPADSELKRNLQGTALFYRAFRYFQLAQTYCLPYSKSTADAKLGLPIRMKPAIDFYYSRGTLNQTYDFIINDLNMSLAFVTTRLNGTSKNRVTLPAIHALLARVYLIMQNYDKALLHAEEALKIYSTLLDYNTVEVSSSPDMLNNSHAEMLIQGLGQFSRITSNSAISPETYVDTTLYASYSLNDLRKSIYYINKAGNIANRRNLYSAIYTYTFVGLATDEIYLVKAECQARAGNYLDAMNTLNSLLIKRWKTGTFVPYTATNKEDALAQILMERRKELVIRGARWNDVRRLNVEGANITMTRNLNGTIYSIEPNSNKYAFPIPPNEIEGSGIEQNPR